MTACGKTHYLLEMLEKEYKNHFDYIFIVCPTFKRNRTYRNWKYINDPDIFVLNCKHHMVENTLQTIIDLIVDEDEDEATTNSLIILDDCAQSKDVKNRTSEIVNLAFSGRHDGISTIIITQQLTSIAKPYRDNISKLVTFYNSFKWTMGYIFDNYLDVEKDEEKRIKNTLKNNDYARLEITTIRPYTHKVIIP